MKDLFTPLSDEEFERLDDFLLDRFGDDDEDASDKDEGVLDICELDGFLTAIVSSPVAVMPSQWLPAVWGDFPPAWKGQAEFEDMFSLLVRHMNGIAGMLLNEPEEFEPVFGEREFEGSLCTIVDEWCEGFWRGVRLNSARWLEGGDEISALLFPILAFTGETKFMGHDGTDEEVETRQQAIAPSVRAIHAYWQARRMDDEPPVQPFRYSEPRVGRNDPCPCGSGKKYKKCCLQ
jgi:uncharacterized protein